MKDDLKLRVIQERLEKRKIGFPITLLKDMLEIAHRLVVMKCKDKMKF